MAWNQKKGLGNLNMKDKDRVVMDIKKDELLKEIQWWEVASC